MSPNAPNVVDLHVDDHMRKSFIDYAMSVIQDRALPDVRDGLKPVHRRILYAMREMGLTPDKHARKSAGVVGEVLKLYHPHGDGSVYDAAVRMAQPWSLLHPLIAGTGNFGNIDGDGPAAYRYTEMKLAPIAMHFFGGIDKETVDVRDNFDGTTTEPTILPVTFPNVLVNGTDGIAVGMATSLPPHNLREVAAAIGAYLDDREITARAIAAIMVAPDFPTGGVVHDLDGYVTALETGRGSVKLRGTWHEETTKTRTLLVIDSIPYQTNKATLVARIGELVTSKVVDDVTDLRDESAKGIVRIVVELRRDVSAEVVFNTLVTRRIGLEVTIAYNAMLLAGKTPRQMGVREIFERWTAFRIETIRRAAVFDLEKARARLHILEGFVKAIGLLDRVIATIRASKDPTVARTALIELLAIDEIAAQAILELRLSKLTNMELEAIEAEHATVTGIVRDLEGLLASERRQIALLRKDLKAVVDAHGRDRQTKVERSLPRVSREELVEREDALVVTTRNGYVRRVAASVVERAGRGRKNRTWLTTAADDLVEEIAVGTSHAYLFAVTARGIAHARRWYDIPDGGTKARHVRNIIEGIDADDSVVRLTAIDDFHAEAYLLTVSRSGAIKRTVLADFAGSVRRGGIAAAKVDDGDVLVSAEVVKTGDDVIVATAGGKAIRFHVDEHELRPMGRTAAGSRALKLDSDDRVVAACTISAEQVRRGAFIACATERGFARKTALTEFVVQARGGKGIVAFPVAPKTGPLVRAVRVASDRDLAISTAKGVTTRILFDDLRNGARSAAGAAVIALDRDDRIVDAAAIAAETE